MSPDVFTTMWPQLILQIQTIFQEWTEILQEKLVLRVVNRELSVWFNVLPHDAIKKMLGTYWRLVAIYRDLISLRAVRIGFLGMGWGEVGVALM